MDYVIQVQKKVQDKDWQEFPEKQYSDLKYVKKYINKQLSDVENGSGDLSVKVVKLEEKQS
jgi:hypothetical protein